MKKKRRRIIALIILTVLLLIPMRMGFKDGGTVAYQAALYRLTFNHSFDDQSPSGFYEATAFSVFPFYLFGLELTFE